VNAGAARAGPRAHPAAGAAIEAPAASADPARPKKAPTVVRMRRKNGVVVQDCTLYVGRACNFGGWRLKKSKWANPFRGAAPTVVRQFRAYIEKQPELLAALPELGGHTLGCWCKPGPCHGDVLVQLYRERVLGGGPAAE
jgi:hypothetical protein